MDTSTPRDAETWYSQLLTCEWDRTVRTAYAAVRAYPDMQDPQGAAEDAAQEAFLLAWQRLAEFRATASPAAWLRGVAWNIARRMVERQQRQHRLLSGSAVAVVAQAHARAEDGGDIGVQEAMAHMGLDTLQPQQREVLYLHYIAEYSTEEIASLLAISQDTIRQRLSRARRAARSLHPWKTVAVPAMALLMARAADDAYADIGQQVFDQLAKPPAPPPGHGPAATGWGGRMLGVGAVLALVAFVVYRYSPRSDGQAEVRRAMPNRSAQFARATLASSPWQASAAPSEEASMVGLAGIEGFVVNDADLPIGGAEVVISTNPRRTVTTEADGWFSFGGLHVADYGIAAHSETSYSQNVRVRASGASAPIKLVVTEGSAITVSVVDEEGRPVSHALVTLRTGLRDETKPVNAQGAYTFRGVEYGWTSIGASAPGLALRESQFNVSGHPNSISYVELVLPPGVAQVGRVVDGNGQPVADAQVKLTSVGGAQALEQEIQTNELGAFTFSGVALGRYTLIAEHKDAGRSGGETISLPQPPTTLTLVRGASVRGKVVDERGHPASGATVSFAVGMSLVGAVTADEAGHFLYGNFGPGEVSVAADTPAAISPVETVSIGTQPVQEVTLVVKAGRIVGRVVDSNGAPVEHAQLESMFDTMAALTEESSPEEMEQARAAFLRVLPLSRGGYATSDASGQFVLQPMRPGRYRIKATNAGGLNVYSYLVNDVATSAEVGDTDVRIVLDRGGDIAGRVVDTHGAPVAEVAISIASSEGSLSFATPVTFRTKAGHFALKDVPPGQVVLAVTGRGFARRIVNADVGRGGGIVNVGDVVVDAGASATGQVIDGDGAPIAGATVWVTTTHSFHLDLLDQRFDPSVQMRGDQIVQTDTAGRFSVTGLQPESMSSYVVVARHRRLGISVPQQLNAGPATLVLTKPGGIEGTLMHRSQAAALQTIELRRMPGDAKSTPYVDFTDGAGKFGIAALPPGTYEFSNGQTCTVNAGEITHVTLASAK